jgi:hypothetical protein
VLFLELCRKSGKNRAQSTRIGATVAGKVGKDASLIRFAGSAVRRRSLRVGTTRPPRRPYRIPILQKTLSSVLGTCRPYRQREGHADCSKVLREGHLLLRADCYVWKDKQRMGLKPVVFRFASFWREATNDDASPRETQCRVETRIRHLCALAAFLANQGVGCLHSDLLGAQHW